MLVEALRDRVRDAQIEAQAARKRTEYYASRVHTDYNAYRYQRALQQERAAYERERIARSALIRAALSS
jgi:hypothetical protein